MRTAWGVRWDTFGEFGLSEAVPCDNAFGTPGTPDSRGVSWFASRLLRLGVRPAHGRPDHPQTQGKVERSSRASTGPTCPRSRPAWTTGGGPSTTRSARTRGSATGPPAARWRPSPRSRPTALPAVEYPPGAVVRKVGSNGLFEYRRARVLAGQGLAGEPVRVEERDDCRVVSYTTREIRRIPLDQLQSQTIL